MYTNTPTLAAAAGLASSFLLESALWYDPELPLARLEWGSWLALFVGVRAFRAWRPDHFVPTELPVDRTSSDNSDNDDEDMYEDASLSEFIQKSLLSLMIGASQIIKWYYDVDWILPIVTAVLYAIFLGYTCQIVKLGAPNNGSSSPFLAPFATFWWRVLLITASCVVCSVLIGLYGYKYLIKSMPALACFGFVALRIPALAILAEPGQSVSRRSMYATFLKTSESVSSRLVLLLLFPAFKRKSPTWLSLKAVGLSMAGAAYWLATFYISSHGGLVPSTTIDTYSSVSAQGLFYQPRRSLAAFLIVSIIAIGQTIVTLPPISRRRGVLLLFALMPISSFLYNARSETTVTKEQFDRKPDSNPPDSAGADGAAILPKADILLPGYHPMTVLHRNAKKAWDEKVARQSRTLDDASEEYVRRYKIRPPEGFGKWFEVAQQNNFVLVDEFDGMMEAIQPLWGVDPWELGTRLRKAASQDASILGVQIKDQHIAKPNAKELTKLPWNITEYLTPEIVKHIPSVEFALNLLDTPRVLLPYDTFSLLLQRSDLRVHDNVDISPSEEEELSEEIHFMNISYQNPWEELTLACPMTSRARTLSHATVGGYTSEVGGFVTDLPKSKDICNSPPLRRMHDFIDQPKEQSFTRSVIPILSRNRLSTFQDLLYPGPWSPDLESEYPLSEDPEWKQKESAVSLPFADEPPEQRDDPQHQSLFEFISLDKSKATFLHKTEAPYKTKHGRSPSARQSLWQTRDDSTTISQILPLLRINDTTAQGLSRKYIFTIDSSAQPSDVRFFRLLRSRSTVLHQAMLHKWYDDWIIPWIHYLPVRMDVDDLPEMVRFLTQDSEGRDLGHQVAQESRDWALRVLRKVDMQLYVWRLLLEYARVVDTQRKDKWCCFDNLGK